MGIPSIKIQNGQKVLYVKDEPFIMISGEVHNSASSSAEFMRPIWEKAKRLKLNSLLLPVSWEMIEPEEGVFDFTIVDALINQAREFNMKIGFLWFGAWKNAQCYYAPEWVKQDLNRFSRAQVEKGKNFLKLPEFYGMPYTTLSAFCEETKTADAKAFQTLMSHIYQVDGSEQTVVTMQVENETGIMGCAREHSDIADQKFAEAVPGRLVSYLKEHKEELGTFVGENFDPNAPEGSSWEAVFGEGAEEIFTAYYTADYVNTVARAGKEVYPIPMAVNCWLDKNQKPGRYPVGGPTAKVMDIWLCAAPAIDVIAPDIYIPAFNDVVKQYHTKGNPLYIAETATHSYAGVREIYSVGKHHIMCFAPFGIEDMGNPFNAMQGRLFGMDTEDEMLKTPQNEEEYAKINELLSGMIPVLGNLYGSEKLLGASNEEGRIAEFSFAPFKITADFGSSYIERTNGACLAAKINENEFLILAMGCTVSFDSTDASLPGVDILKAEQGSYVNGEFHADCRLNGDETAIMIAEKPTLYKVKLFAY